VRGCRELKSRAAVLTSWNSLLAQLSGTRPGDKAKEGILSLTLARQKKDLTASEFQILADLLKSLHEAGVITYGAAASERGDRMQHLHLQCMLRLPSLNVNAVEVQQACADLVYKHTEFMEGQGHAYAEVHWPDAQPNVTWRTMVGYVCYDNAVILITSHANVAASTISCCACMVVAGRQSSSQVLQYPSPQVSRLRHLYCSCACVRYPQVQCICTMAARMRCTTIDHAMNDC
jgi:hypothetical protein